MNIFKDLSKYGSSEEENYLTESFVYLLRLLFAEQPRVGFDLLNKLLNFPILEHIQTPALPIFATQEMVEGGIPDIAITLNSDLLAYIEIKHDAPLGSGQLEYYKGLLEKSGTPHQVLVLLTRSKQSSNETTLPADQYTHICWYEVHAWLQDLLGLDSVVDHFIEDFLVFLEEKKMSLQRVGWEYEKGVSSLLDLTTMLEAALTEVFTDSLVAKAAGWYWRGFKLKSIYYVGVRFSEPNVIAFDDSYSSNPTFKRELDLEEKHFFSLKSGEQFECILAFLRDTANDLPNIAEETSP
jgi:hypothetical protein